jgi:hypothetical protein
MDAILRRALREHYGKDHREVAVILAEKLVKQGIGNGRARLSIVKFVTERMDGKPVQPVKDVTPGLRLAHLSDEELARLLDKREGPSQPDLVPPENLDPPLPSPKAPEPEAAIPAAPPQPEAIPTPIARPAAPPSLPKPADGAKVAPAAAHKQRFDVRGS